jgi:hypothetical protein
VLNKDYIIPSLSGRLGNHMFMIAHAYAKALEYNKQFVISKEQARYIDYDYCDNVFRKIQTIPKLIDNGNYNPSVPSNDKHTLYSGYFQSEQHFERYSEAIKTLFMYDGVFEQYILAKFPKLKSERNIAISVRKGDYLIYPDYHPTVSAEYLNKLIGLFPNTSHCFIFSDDLEWCKQNIDTPKSVTYCDNLLPHEQLWMMSMCHDFIISNSSFSWWGAYLSRCKNKVVKAPQTWFGPKGPASWGDMYCKGWDVVPTYFKNGLIYPL